MTHWSRLSSALALARAWLLRNQSLARELQQALAEVRRLKKELQLCEKDNSQSSDNWDRERERLEVEAKHMAAVIAECERDLRGKDHEIAQLLSQVQLDRLEITGQSRVNTALMADLDKIIAQRVADASRATTNGHATSGIENLL